MLINRTYLLIEVSMFVEIRDVLGVDMYSIYDCSCGDNNSSTDVSKKQNSFVEIRVARYPSKYEI